MAMEGRKDDAARFVRQRVMRGAMWALRVALAFLSHPPASPARPHPCPSPL